MTSQPDVAAVDDHPSASPSPRALVGRLDRVRSRVHDAARLGPRDAGSGRHLGDADYFPAVGNGPITDISLTIDVGSHLLGGAVLIVAGLCVFAGQIARGRRLRAVGSLIGSLAFVGSYPSLALVMVARPS